VRGTVRTYLHHVKLLKFTVKSVVYEIIHSYHMIWRARNCVRDKFHAEQICC
jgi:hypothetical protein